MTWTGDFQDKLNATGPFEPIIILHVMKWAGTPGREFKAASHPGYNYPEIIGPSVALTGSSISPTSWTFTHGTCSLDIITDDISQLTEYAKRGAICQILMGFTEWDEADFQPIFVGKVQNIRGRNPNYSLDLWSGTSLLSTRLNVGSFSVFSANRQNIFYNVKSSQRTTLTSAYSTSDNTLDVADASKLEMPSASSTYPGVVYVDNGSDDPFYLTYTGKSSNQLTGVTTSDILGTTRAASGTSSTKVYNAAYLAGNPFEILLRILTSGSGPSSPYDVYPDSFGYGLPYSLTDPADMFNVFAAMASAAGGITYQLAYAQSVEVGDSWAWVREFFRDIGLVVVQRHGRLTYRPIQDPNNPLLESGISITDHDIMEVLDFGAYHPDTPAEYQRVRVAVSGISVSTTMRPPETAPMADQILFDNTDKVFASGTAIANEIKSRVQCWGPNVPEYVTLRCAGVRLAVLAPLDIVKVSSSLIGKGRIDQTKVQGYQDQACMVLRVSPDFYLGQVELTVAAIDPF